MVALSARTLPKMQISRTLSGYSALLALGCSLPACSAKQDEKPPYMAACEAGNAGCGVGSIRGGAGVSPVGAAGAGGGASPPVVTGREVSVSGKVELYRDEQFTGKTAYGEPVIVAADGAKGSRVTSLYLGNGVFKVNVQESANNWFSAAPEGAQDALTTLWSFNTQANKVTDLVLVRSSAIDSVFTLAQIPSPRIETAAHVVVNVFDANGLPLAGVLVNGPANTPVAYAVGLTWASELGETSALGRAFVGNISAAPGALRDITLTLSGSLERQVPVRVSGGAVSVVAVRP